MRSATLFTAMTMGCLCSPHIKVSAHDTWTNRPTALTPTGSSTLPEPVNSGSTLSLTYTRDQQTHVSYAVKVSSDLGLSDPWTTTGVNQGTPDAGGVTTAAVPVTANP